MPGNPSQNNNALSDEESSVRLEKIRSGKDLLDKFRSKRINAYDDISFITLLSDI